MGDAVLSVLIASNTFANRDVLSHSIVIGNPLYMRLVQSTERI